MSTHSVSSAPSPALAAQLRFGVAAARFNPEVTRRLHDSCVRALVSAGVLERHIETVWVPGSYELPWAANELALQDRFDAVVALGCILKGETPQNDHIAAACAKSLQEIAAKTRVPVVFGVITPRDSKQALARTRGGKDRGKEAGEVALAMAALRAGLKRR